MPNLPNDQESLDGTREWPHAPPHRLGLAGVFFVTGSTLDKRLLFKGDERLDLLSSALHELAGKYGWQLEAWAVMANHYHVVIHSPPKVQDGTSMRKFLSHLHTRSATAINKLDGTLGRRVWYNFRETHLTYQTSYLARLNYTHHNAVHHRLVPVASQYRWCSAGAFEAACTPAWVKTIQGFKTDFLHVEDDF
jgi:putative transposase